MSPSLRLQLSTNIGTWMAAAIIHVSVADQVPRWALLAVDACLAAVLLTLLHWVIVTRANKGRFGEPGSDRWYADGLRRLWIANLGIVAIFIVIGPYTEERWRLALALFLMALVAIDASLTTRLSGLGGRLLWGALLPLVPSLGAVLSFTLNPVSLTPAIIAIFAVGTVVLLSGREFTQSRINQAYAELGTAKAERDAEHLAKQRFLASASHDLTQPLQAARLSFEQAISAESDAARGKATRRVRWAFDATEQLLSRMIENLKIDARAVAPEIAPFGCGAVIAQVAEMNEAAARAAGITLHAMPTSRLAISDAHMVERIVGNLVANAIRHSKGTKILIGARRTGLRVRIWVIDNGRGVLEVDRGGLFVDYVQGSDHGDEIRGGFGLGLATSRQIAGLINADVGHDSRWKNGSAFWIELSTS